MNFSVVVFDEFFDEGSVLVEHFVPHVGDVVEHRLVLHHEVLLERGPAVHGRDRVHGVDDLQSKPAILDSIDSWMISVMTYVP